MALKAIYGPAAKGVDVLSRFDLVVGNSGGSIVIAMLASNRTLQQIIDVIADPVLNVRSQIFQALPFYDQIGRLLGIGPQYSTAAKLPALTQVIDVGPPSLAGTNKPATVPLANLSAFLGIGTQFIIPSFDFDMERAHLFRSNPTSPAANFVPIDTTTTLVQAVHASSTPPVQYFDAPAVIPAGRFWDGGVSGYNNPVEIAVVELTAMGVDKGKILALSLGSGNVALPPLAPGGAASDPSLVQGPRDTGIIASIKELAGSIVDDPPDVATLHATMFLSGIVPANAQSPIANGPIVRLNPLIRPLLSAGTWTAPVLNSPANATQDLSDFQTLINLGLDAVAQPDVDAIVKLGTAWIAGVVRNQPIRWRQAEDVGCEIGTIDFASGAALATARFS
jgi:hypothetical protein